jgi:OOP family OmpA-OmpF porin
MLDEGDYPVPTGWRAALGFGIEALSLLENSKISVAADEVTVTAITESTEARSRLEEELRARIPDGLDVSLEISAPRPVITPFTLRVIKDARGLRFDACSAATEEGRARILAAATRAGLQGRASCLIGLGVPSPNWAAAAEVAIEKLGQLDAGNITFSDADVTLIADETVPQEAFDRVAGELKAELPAVFSLRAILPEPPETDASGAPKAAPEFIATRDAEGLVELRGRLKDELMQSAVTSFAKAQFGSDSVYTATRHDEDLPDGWPIRVLAGLAAMAELKTGQLKVQPDSIVLSGETGNPNAQDVMARVLSDRLGGDDQNYTLDITYVEQLDPQAALPTPQECVARIQEAIDARKITFSPGSIDIDGESLPTVDKIAVLLDDCSEVKMEIGGHTDSQGREQMNQALSQARADAVLNALIARQVLTGNLTARGYGETQPIADNDTEEGRELNRRIEFKLLEPADADAESDTESDANSGAAENADASGTGSGEAGEAEEAPPEPSDAGDADAAEADTSAESGTDTENTGE